MTMSRKIYAITLSPLGPFFFGGEKAMGESDEADYFVPSNCFPQQTGLLGFLRYELLRQNNLLGFPLKPEAVNLIGKAGFPTGNYNALESISPVFLAQRDKRKMHHWFPERLDRGYTYVKAGGETMINSSIRFNKVPFLKDYDPKNEPQLVFSAERQADLKSENEIFRDQQQVGIEKKNKEKAFFKLTLKRLQPGWGFKFYAILDLPDGTRIGDDLVWFGGNHSMFKMEVEELNRKTEDGVIEYGWQYGRPEVGEYKSGNAIVLKAPAYLAPEDFCAHFALSRTLPFRHIKSTSEVKEYYARPKSVGTSGENNDRAVLGKSGYCELFDKGSVFYFHDLNSLNKMANSLTKHKAFRQIGYNYFQVI